jgi:prepilin-type processing-associated H-X9-DG protein
MIGEKNFNIGRLGYWQPEDDAGFVEGWDFDTIRWGYVPPAPDDDDFRDTYNNTQYRSTALRAAFGSSHPGKFNTAFADGHLRSISFSIALNVFMEVSSRNDGQVFDFNDF